MGLELLIKKIKFSNIIICIIICLNFYTFYQNYNYLNNDIDFKNFKITKSSSNELWNDLINEIQRIKDVLRKIN